MESSLSLEATGLVKSFYPGKPVLNGVTLSLRKGERIALLGANGSGKSTLLRCLAGIHLQDFGSVSLFGIPRTSATTGTIQRRLAFVFQHHNLVPQLSALSNVIHGACNRSQSPRLWFQSLAPTSLRNEALECLQRVGLQDKALSRVSSLSGGQSQRVAIARSLMQRPELLMADEPVASLDPIAGKEVMELFVELAKEHSCTLIFSTHHVEHACAYAERIIALKEGRLILNAKTEDVSPQEIAELYERKERESEGGYNR